jgi:hypothetical protein
LPRDGFKAELGAPRDSGVSPTQKRMDTRTVEKCYAREIDRQCVDRKNERRQQFAKQHRRGVDIHFAPDHGHYAVVRI